MRFTSRTRCHPSPSQNSSTAVPGALWVPPEPPMFITFVTPNRPKHLPEINVAFCFLIGRFSVTFAPPFRTPTGVPDAIPGALRPLVGALGSPVGALAGSKGVRKHSRAYFCLICGAIFVYFDPMLPHFECAVGESERTSGLTFA